MLTVGRNRATPLAIPIIMNKFYASPRHLAQQIKRCLRVLGTATTTELVNWAYCRGLAVKKRAKWYAWNVRRAARQWGIRQVGKRGRAIVWSL